MVGGDQSLKGGWIVEGICLIKPGAVDYDETTIHYASSSVVLIETDVPILVDTGRAEDWAAIKKGLGEAGFRVGDIGAVINTHLHPDHAGCNQHFKAPKYAHPKEILRAGEGRCLPYNVASWWRVRVVETPGHVEGHISVVYEGAETVVVAGDAVPTFDNFLKMVVPRIHTDAQEALRSMKLIGALADIVIPGHGPPSASIGSS